MAFAVILLDSYVLLEDNTNPEMKKTMNQQMDITCAKVNAAEAKQNFTDC